MVTEDCSSGRHGAESVAGSAALAAPRRRPAPATTGSKGSCGEVSSAVRQPHHTSSEDTLSYEPSVSETGDIEPEELPDGQIRVPVVVGTTKGVYLVQKNKVLYNGEEVAPTVFEATGGKANTRKWRSTLRVLLPDGAAGKRLGVWLWDHGFHTWALPAKRKRSADQDGKAQQQQQQGSQAPRCSAAASRSSSLPSSPTKGPPSPAKSSRPAHDSLPGSPGGCPHCVSCRAAAAAAAAPKPQPATSCGGHPGRHASRSNAAVLPHNYSQPQRPTAVAAEAKAFLASLPPSAQAVLGPPQPQLLAAGRPPYYPFWPPPPPQQAYEGGPPSAQLQWLLPPPGTHSSWGPPQQLFPPAGNPSWQRQQGPASPQRQAAPSGPANPAWSPLSSLRSTFSRLAGQAKVQACPPASPGTAPPAGPSRRSQQASQLRQPQRQQQGQQAQQSVAQQQQQQDEGDAALGDAAHYMLADVPPVLPKHREHRRLSEQRKRRQAQPLGSAGSGPSTAGTLFGLDDIDLSECTPVLPEEAGWPAPAASFGRDLAPAPTPLAVAAPSAAARQQQAGAAAAWGPRPAFPLPALALPVPAAANLRQPMSRSPSPPVQSPPSPLSPPPLSPAAADYMDMGERAATPGKAVRQHGQQPAAAAPHATAHPSSVGLSAGEALAGAAAVSEGGIDELDLDWLVQEGDLDLAALLAQDSPQPQHPAEQQAQQPEQQTVQREEQQRLPQQQDLATETRVPRLSLQRRSHASAGQQLPLPSSAVRGPTTLPTAMHFRSGHAAAALQLGGPPGQAADEEGGVPLPSAAAGADSEADLLAELLSSILPSPRDASPCPALPVTVPTGPSLPAASLAPTARQLPQQAQQEVSVGPQQAQQAPLAVVELWPFDVDCEADQAAAAAALGGSGDLAMPAAAAGLRDGSPGSNQGSGKQQPLPSSGSAFDLQVYAGMGLPSPDEAALKCSDTGLAFNHSPGPSFWLTSP